jgi:hypothetical protein
MDIKLLILTALIGVILAFSRSRTAGDEASGNKAIAP